MPINLRSKRATTRNPVTADCLKVFFVTVDGRITNNKGMPMSDFVTYLVSLGAHME